MKRISILASLLFIGPALALEPPRVDGEVPLAKLVGTWTIEGKEKSYRETCRWFHGRRHVVCETQSTKSDGSVSHGMSILAFVPGKGYVYTGIGSGGRYETYQGGTYEQGVLEYLDRTAEGTTRIRVGPFTDATRVPFRVHASKDGADWELVDEFVYVAAP